MVPNTPAAQTRTIESTLGLYHISIKTHKRARRNTQATEKGIAHKLRKEDPQQARQHICWAKKTLTGQGSTYAVQIRPSTGKAHHT